MLRNKDGLIVMRHDEPERKIGGLVELMGYIEAEDKIMVEVGSYMGESADIFATKVAILTCVDSWIPGYDDKDAASSTDMKLVEETFDKIVSDHSGKITKIKGKSEDVCPRFEDNSLDIVYIDAEHTYRALTRDISIWKEKVKDTGWICGHDWQREDLRRAIIEVLGQPDKTFKDDSWCFKKDRLKPIAPQWWENK